MGALRGGGGWDLKSAKEHLHVVPDGAVLRLRNLTAEEREFVEQHRDALSSLWGINITIEEDMSNDQGAETD